MEQKVNTGNVPRPKPGVRAISGPAVTRTTSFGSSNSAFRGTASKSRRSAGCTPASGSTRPPLLPAGATSHDADAVTAKEDSGRLEASRLKPARRLRSVAASVQLRVLVHDDRFSTRELIVNPNSFPFAIKPGQLLEFLLPPSAAGSSGCQGPEGGVGVSGSSADVGPISSVEAGDRNWRRYELRSADTEAQCGDKKNCRLIVQVSSIDDEIVTKQPSLQISICKEIANLFGLQARTNVTVKEVYPANVTAEYIEILFKDQYIGRSEMWRLKMGLTGTCVFVGKKITFAGCLRAQVKEVYIDGESVASGYITENTKAIFRSESAKFFVFIQMSKEMWEFEEDGELFLEKAVYGFLPSLFRRWKEIGANHVVSIVLVARIFYDNTEISTVLQDRVARLLRDNRSRYYQDFYKVVVDWENRADWMPIAVRLKREFVSFRREIMERRRQDGVVVLCGQNSLAYEGNILEAVNLALNPFDKHYVDRDLLRTGLSIVFITPGTGIFEVDSKLLRLTTDRIIDNGIGLDVVCLSKPPLHTVPLFRCRVPPSDGPLSKSPNGPNEVANGVVYADSSSSKVVRAHSKGIGADGVQDLYDALYEDELLAANSNRYFYSFPHWIDCSFYREEGESPPGCRGFVPRCKMYELQMMGIIINGASFSMRIPYMDDIEYSNVFTSSRTVSNEENANKRRSWPVALSGGEESATRRRKMSFSEHEHQRQPMSLSEDNSHLKWKACKLSERVDEYDGAVFGCKDRGSPRMRKHQVREGLVSESSLDLTAQLLGNTTLTLENPGGEPGWPYAEARHEGRLSDAGSPGLTGKSERRVGTQVGVSFIVDNADSGISQTSSTVKPISIKSAPNAGQSHSFVAAASTTGKGPKESSGTASWYGNSPQNSYASDVTYATKPSTRNSPGRAFDAAKAGVQQRSNVINPFNPSKSTFRMNSQVRRWHHLWPKASLQAVGYGTKWNSLCAPGSLPLTTDYFPSQDELANFYEEYTYTVSPNEDPSPYQEADVPDQRKTESLLKELISQRLAQGFQLIVSSNLESSIAVPGSSTNQKRGAAADRLVSSSRPSTGSLAVPFADQQRIVKVATKPYYLSMGHQVHRLAYDSSGQNVEVKRYVRKQSYGTDPVEYTCLIWPSQTEQYQQRKATFTYPSLSNYNWNYLDHFVSGYQEEMTEALRYWRTRFILVPLDVLPTPNLFSPPNESLDEEELRLAGFHKFLEVFQKACWTPRGESGQLGQKRVFKLPITYTTFDLPEFAMNEILLSNDACPTSSQKKSAGSSGGDRLTKDSKFTAIAQAMKNSVTGVKMMDRRWHFRTFENAFIGAEAVDWLISSFTDIDTREEALEFGNYLLSKGFIVHVNRRHRFLDGHYFYHLSPEFAPSRAPAKSWFRHSKAASGPDSAKASAGEDGGGAPGNGSGSTPTLSGAGSQPPTPGSATSQLERRGSVRMEFSKSMLLDVDPLRKSDRRETAVLHYDVVHNPKNCYHFQLNWLACTARLIEDMLQSWARTADKCGLKLIEAPVEQAFASANDNPFQSPVLIPLSVPPPPVPDAPGEKSVTPRQDRARPLAYESALAQHHGFILDVDADAYFPDVLKRVYSYRRVPFRWSQFVHRSGVAFVQVVPGEGFLWTNNRLLTSHAGNPGQGKAASANATASPDELRVKLQRFCADPEELARFWDEVTARLAAPRPAAAATGFGESPSKSPLLSFSQQLAPLGGGDEGDPPPETAPAAKSPLREKRP